MTLINNLIEGRTLALVGAGQLAKMAIDLWPQQIPMPKFLLDSNKRGFLEGLPILPLQQHTRIDEVTYVQCAFKNITPTEVLALFSKKFNQKIVTIYDVLNLYLPKFFSNGWGYSLIPPGSQSQIDTVRSYVRDAASLLALDSVIAWRYGRNLIPQYPLEHESLKYNILRFHSSNVVYDLVVDGGSYDLGMYKALKGLCVKFNDYVAFEPDPLSFELCRKISLQSELKNVLIENLALARDSGTRPFHSSGGFASRIVQAGQFSCETTCLDSYIRCKFPSLNSSSRILVKLHTEGAELEGILGASNSLLKFKVDFIISLSHTEEALLKILPYLASHGDYKIFLRSSSLFGDGFYLFAVKC